LIKEKPILEVSALVWTTLPYHLEKKTLIKLCGWQIEILMKVLPVNQMQYGKE